MRTRREWLGSAMDVPSQPLRTARSRPQGSRAGRHVVVASEVGPEARRAAEREAAVVSAQTGSGGPGREGSAGRGRALWRVCEVVGKVAHPRGTVRNGDGRVPLR